MAFLGIGNTGLDVTQSNIRAYQNLTVTEQTSTTIAGDFRLIGQPGHVVRFNGTGLGGSIEAGRITGTLTELRVTLNGALLFEITGVAVPAQAALGLIGSGNAAAAAALTFSGNDLVQGGAGDDVLGAYRGNNMIVGGGGADTATIDAPRLATLSYRYGDEAVVFRRADGQADRLVGVEAVRFWDGTVAQAALTAARPFQYLATYGDLAAAFGSDAAAAWQHFAGAGLIEGRAAGFSGLGYIASYGDLRAAFGADAEAGARHFLQYGRAEGRAAAFDAAQYLAANIDLRAAFGADLDRAAAHYIQGGAAEGRTISFDGLRYIASYGDLIRVLPKTVAAGAMHFISSGAAQGRTVTFDPLRYIASNRDLAEAFGTNEGSGLQHWLSSGFAEGRTATAFDAGQYLANYADLRAAFGADLRAATQHWVQGGAAEGRTFLAPA